MSLCFRLLIETVSPSDCRPTSGPLFALVPVVGWSAAVPQADAGGMTENLTASTGPTGSPQPFLVRAGRMVAHRWAAGLGLGLGLLSVDGLESGVELGTALALAALGYLLVAVVGRPGITWPAVAGLGV